MDNTSTRELRAFVTLALRHACAVKRPSATQVDACLARMHAQASCVEVASAIADVACGRGDGALDIRRPVFRERIARLMGDSLALCVLLRAGGG